MLVYTLFYYIAEPLTNLIFFGFRKTLSAANQIRAKHHQKATESFPIIQMFLSSKLCYIKIFNSMEPILGHRNLDSSGELSVAIGWRITQFR